MVGFGMSRVLSFTALSISSFLLAVPDTEILPSGWPGVLMQGGAFSLLCCVLWWLLTRYVPSLTEAFNKNMANATSELAAERNTFEKEMAATRLTFEREMKNNRELFEQRIGIADQKLRDKDERLIE